MGREIHDPTVIHSSIALLQERFRQLQRVKEMREERELLKMLSAEPKHFNSNPNMTCCYEYEPTRLFFHHEVTIPSRPPPPRRVSLSLWPPSQGMEEDNNTDIFGTPVSLNLRPTDHITRKQSLQASWNNVCDWDSTGSDSGVDTTLHL